MPVSIDEFESDKFPGSPSIPEQIVRFLYSERDKAFTRSEIATAIDANPNTVGTALSRLKDRDLVRHRGTYWALVEDTDRVAAAYDLAATTERLDESDGGIASEAWQDAAPDMSHPSERTTNDDR